LKNSHIALFRSQLAGIGDAGLVAIAAGNGNTDGTLYAWGNKAFGELGIGAMGHPNSPNLYR